MEGATRKTAPVTENRAARRRGRQSSREITATIAGTAWEAFKANPNPLSKIREIHAALRDDAQGGRPGLPAMYAEVAEKGTLFGIRVLVMGNRPYVPRQKVIDKIEGRDG